MEEGVDIIGGPVYNEILKIFSYYIFINLVNFICLAWMVKNLKDSFEEALQLPTEISHILFRLPILILSLFYIYLFWKFHVSSLNGRKAWILNDPILVPKFC